MKCFPFFLCPPAPRAAARVPAAPPDPAAAAAPAGAETGPPLPCPLSRSHLFSRMKKHLWKAIVMPAVINLIVF